MRDGATPLPPPRLTAGTLLDRLRESLRLTLLNGEGGLERLVTSPESASPGLVLAGWTGRFLSYRIQVLGETEIRYLGELADAERERILGLLFSYPIPCVFITKGLDAPEGLLRAADAAGVAVIRSELKTAEFYRRLNSVLEGEFAPTVHLHGSLADVFGVGLFFTGKSGIGKSECVLDLVERGHRLVADDLVICTRRGSDVLIGRGHELQRHYMEIRGVGLIDIPALFGIRAVRQQKRIEVIVNLAEWTKEMMPDRTGLDVETCDILGVPLPRITVPLNPGKNITVIAEVIAMNHLLRYSGVDAAEQFNQRLLARMQQRKNVAGRARAQEVLAQYLQEDDE